MEQAEAAQAHVPVRPRVAVVMPAFNAARTLRMTYHELPKDRVDLVILVDDGSTDETVQVAKELDLDIFVHTRNFGYGANQKTCYREALKADAEVIVMLHPDYQYAPTLLPTLVEPLARGDFDVVLGSRLMGDSPVKQGMPWWKYVGNRLLTRLENKAFGLSLAEYHTGYRAYARHVLETVNFSMNSDGFVFDQEILAQVVEAGFRIGQVPVPTRYFAEASSASFAASCHYGLSILSLLARYVAHRKGWLHVRQFDSLDRRYRRVV
jgi:glycosyltransferase involved in cell wall biosynthesis